jgi:hypothetical protein
MMTVYFVVRDVMGSGRLHTHPTLARILFAGFTSFLLRTSLSVLDPSSFVIDRRNMAYF